MWMFIAWILSRPRIANWLIWKSMQTPYSTIIHDGKVYMERYWLFNPYGRGPDGQEESKYKWFPWNIRIHWIRRPDSDDDMHDHPWNARTIILRGGYIEERPGKLETVYVKEPPIVRISRYTGSTAKLKFGEFHRITHVQAGGAWTLFISGPYQGSWGFKVNGVKVHWKTYLGIK